MVSASPWYLGCESECESKCESDGDDADEYFGMVTWAPRMEFARKAKTTNYTFTKMCNITLNHLARE